MTPASLLLIPIFAAGVDAVTLGAESWTTASPAAALATQEPVRRLVQALESTTDSVLVIRHAGGEADSSRAVSLRVALVALGIPSARVRLEPAAADPRILILELAAAGGNSP